jgi:hypothetical protein
VFRYFGPLYKHAASLDRCGRIVRFMSTVLDKCSKIFMFFIPLLAFLRKKCPGVEARRIEDVCESECKAARIVKFSIRLR